MQLNSCARVGLDRLEHAACGRQGCTAQGVLPPPPSPAPPTRADQSINQYITRHQMHHLQDRPQVEGGEVGQHAVHIGGVLGQPVEWKQDNGGKQSVRGVCRGRDTAMAWRWRCKLRAQLSGACTCGHVRGRWRRRLRAGCPVQRLHQMPSPALVWQMQGAAAATHVLLPRPASVYLCSIRLLFTAQAPNPACPPPPQPANSAQHTQHAPVHDAALGSDTN